MKDLCKWGYNFCIWLKTLWQKEKLLIMSNLYFCHNGFKCNCHRCVSWERVKKTIKTDWKTCLTTILKTFLFSFFCTKKTLKFGTIHFFKFIIFTYNCVSTLWFIKCIRNTPLMLGQKVMSACKRNYQTICSRLELLVFCSLILVAHFIF